jgi:hypothetical protein
MPRAAMDYGKTNIYKIVCNDLTIKDCYVGHTINMTERKCAHKTHCNNEKDKRYNFKIYQIIRENGGWDNWNMVLVEKFPCNNRQEACKREREVLEELDAKMNTLIPYRTQEERKKERKEYYQEHKAGLKQYIKQYHQEHKAEINENRKEKLKEKIECKYCAKRLTKGSMYHHRKICKSKE